MAQNQSYIYSKGAWKQDACYIDSVASLIQDGQYVHLAGILTEADVREARLIMRTMDEDNCRQRCEKAFFARDLIRALAGAGAIPY